MDVRPLESRSAVIHRFRYPSEERTADAVGFGSLSLHAGAPALDAALISFEIAEKLFSSRDWSTIFTIILPLETTTERASAAVVTARSGTAAPQPAGSSDSACLRQLLAAGLESQRAAFSILLVDDNAVNRKLTSRLLMSRGFSKIDIAEHGQQALERVAEKPGFALILMDCEMVLCVPVRLILILALQPIMDGFEATRRLRSQGCKTPIIALTAAATLEVRTQCLEAGSESPARVARSHCACRFAVDRYMTKPSTNCATHAFSDAHVLAVDADIILLEIARLPPFCEIISHT